MGETLAAVAIADDGELDELRGVLDELRVSYADQHRARGAAEAALRAGLLFATPRHALALEARSRRGAAALARDLVVVLDAGSARLGRMLERTGASFVLRAPVHREVYRLLVERSLYRGTERRRHARVALGAPIKLRVGRRTHAATLCQLSRRGCGLKVDAEIEAGTELTLMLPPELGGGARLALDGKVVLSRDAAGGGQYSVVFGALEADVSKRLRTLLQERAAEGMLLPVSASGCPPQPDENVAARASAAPPDPAPASSGRERRRSPRGAYTRRVLASGAGVGRMLAGRDLSTGGMRVERSAELALGDELKLALYGQPGGAAVLVRARVARDAGARGWVLEFLGVSPAIAALLDELVRSLPRLDEPRDDAGGPALVVSRIVEDD